MANPINTLCAMIASLHDADGRVTVPGFYDDVVELSAEDRAMLARAPFDMDEYKAFLVARRSGQTWYVAGINGTEEDAAIAFSLKRLDSAAQTAQLFSDGETDRDIRVSSLPLGDGPVRIPCRPRGGFLLVIR